MDIKITKSLDGTGHEYKVGETIKDADTIFGPAQAAYLVECGFAEFVHAKKETATAKTGETPEK